MLGRRGEGVNDMIQYSTSQNKRELDTAVCHQSISMYSKLFYDSHQEPRQIERERQTKGHDINNTY